MNMLDVSSKPLHERLRSTRDYLKQRKVNFDAMYDVLAKYFYQIKRGQAQNSSMSAHVTQGGWENDGDISTGIGTRMANAQASAIAGMMWKNGSSTFRLVKPKLMVETDSTKAYYKRINELVTMFMDRPASRFELSYNTTVLEDVVFGSCALAVDQGNYQTPLRYKNKSILNMYWSFNADGEVDVIYYDYELTVRQIYEAYPSKAPEEIVNAYHKGQYEERYLVTEAIEPRIDPMAEAGKLAMPFASYIFLPDMDDGVLDEGGYESLPIIVGFWSKLDYEDYGRGPASFALPTLMQVNSMEETFAVASELKSQPAMYMYDNGSLAGNAIDFSPGAFNVFNVVGTMPTNAPAAPLFSVGDLSAEYQYWQTSIEQLSSHFMLDRLFDLNSDQRMTLGETNIRAAIRSDSLASRFAHETAFLVRVIERTMDILFGMGLLGVRDATNTADPLVINLIKNGYEPFTIPSEVHMYMDKGLDWYDIEFISPAARTMKSDELSSLMTYANLMGQAAQVMPEVLDPIDPDAFNAKVRDLTSVDPVINRTPEAILGIRDNRAQMQQMQMQMMMQSEQAKANQSNAQAAAAMTGAQRNMMGISPQE